jgi:hypothetical protein
MSTPEWKAPSPLKGSSRSPKELVMGPMTGQSVGAPARLTQFVTSVEVMPSSKERKLPVSALVRSEAS